MPDGRMLSKWDDEFEVPGSIGFGTNTHQVPENLEIREIPFKKLFPTFEEYMEKWEEVKKNKNGRYGYYRNPNAKWDWFAIGGRWTGFFKLKSVEIIPTKISPKRIALLAAKYGITKEAVCEIAEAAKNDANNLFAVAQKHFIKGGYHLEKEIISLITPQYSNAKVGDPGIMTEVAKEGYADQTIKGNRILQKHCSASRWRNSKIGGSLGNTS